jgi:acyl-CoA synthetase (AMP-forming)/AMP-acid ligase II
MFIDFLIRTIKNNQYEDAIIWKDQIFKYKWLLERISFWQNELISYGIKPGAVTILEADFSPNAIALFIALIEQGCMLVPLTYAVESKKPEFIKIAQGEFSISIDRNDKSAVKKLQRTADHEFYQKLRRINHPGLVLFSSGSTGKSKAAVHDVLGILEKFKLPRHRMRAISFLLYDHIGGINTLLYILSNGGCIVTVEDRSPDGVLQAIERHKVDLLPTSPSFLNLILLSGAYNRYNLNSLKTISYGTEPMPEITLKRLHELFPKIRLQQTYGLSELGILRSKSESSDSLWFKIGGEGYDTRIVDGVLQIKAKSAMLGYINSPNPFIDDGWFNTDDSIEIKGEYIKILGRKSEIINVGGEKVYPTEVENVIQGIANVSEVTIYGEKNPILGEIVCAKVSLLNDEDPKTFNKRLRQYCNGKLERYKIPVKVDLVSEKQHSDRFKKIRYYSHDQKPELKSTS